MSAAGSTTADDVTVWPRKRETIAPNAPDHGDA